MSNNNNNHDNIKVSTSSRPSSNNTSPTTPTEQHQQQQQQRNVIHNNMNRNSNNNINNNSNNNVQIVNTKTMESEISPNVIESLQTVPSNSRQGVYVSQPNTPTIKLSTMQSSSSNSGTAASSSSSAAATAMVTNVHKGNLPQPQRKIIMGGAKNVNSSTVVVSSHTNNNYNYNNNHNNNNNPTATTNMNNHNSFTTSSASSSTSALASNTGPPSTQHSDHSSQQHQQLQQQHQQQQSKNNLTIKPPTSNERLQQQHQQNQQQQQSFLSKSNSVPSSPTQQKIPIASHLYSLPSSPTTNQQSPPASSSSSPSTTTATTSTPTTQQQAQSQQQQSQQQEKEEKKYSDYLYGAIPVIVQNTTQQQNGLEAIIQYFNHRSQLEGNYSTELRKMSQAFSSIPLSTNTTNNNNQQHQHQHENNQQTTNTTTTTGYSSELAQVINGMKNMTERLALRHSNFSKDIQFGMCGPLTEFNNDLLMYKKRLLNASQQLDRDLMIGLNAVEKNKQRQHRVAHEAEDVIMKAQRALQKSLIVQPSSSSSSSQQQGEDMTDHHGGSSSGSGGTPTVGDDHSHSSSLLSSSPSSKNNLMFHMMNERNKWKHLTENAVREAKIADMQYADTVTQMRLYQERFQNEMSNILNTFQSNDIQLLQICKTFLNHYISFEEQLVRDFQRDLELLRNSVNQINVQESIDRFIVLNQTNQRPPDLIPYEPYVSPLLNPQASSASTPSSSSSTTSHQHNQQGNAGGGSQGNVGTIGTGGRMTPIARSQKSPSQQQQQHPNRKPSILSTSLGHNSSHHQHPQHKNQNANQANNHDAGVAVPSKTQRLQKWFQNFTGNQLKLLPRSAVDGDFDALTEHIALMKPSRPLPPVPQDNESTDEISGPLTSTTSMTPTGDMGEHHKNNAASSTSSSSASSMAPTDSMDDDRELLKDIMTNFNDQEFRRDQLDIEEVKRYEDLLFRIFAIGEMSEEEQDQVVAQVNDLSDLLTLQTSMGSRLALAMAMNHIRADPCITNPKSFTIVAQLVTTAMEKSHEFGDANVGRLFLNMSQTFYRKKRNASTGEETQEYLQQYLRDLHVWKDIRFWEGAFFDALSYERKKSEWNDKKKWRYLDQEQRAEVVVQHENMVFGLLGSFAFNMLNMGVSVSDCRLFMEKMCMINSLKDEYTELLMNNIDTTYIAIRATEERSSSSSSSLALSAVARHPARPRANASIMVDESQTVYLSDTSELDSDEYDSSGSVVTSNSFIYPSFQENYFLESDKAPPSSI